MPAAPAVVVVAEAVAATLESALIAVVGARVRARKTTSPSAREAAVSTAMAMAAPYAGRMRGAGAETSGGREVATAIDTVAFEL